MSGLSGAKFIPVIDDDFIEESATVQLQKGNFVKVPYLIGANADEGTAFAVEGVNTDAEFRELVKDWGLNNATTDVLEALYPDIPQIGIPAIMVGRPPSGYGNQYKRVAAFQGDVNIHAARRLTSHIWSSRNISVYSYRFDVISPGYGPSAGSYAGATHGTEIPYVFYNLDGLGYDSNNKSIGSMPNSYSRMSKIMSRMWVSFVTTLDPNHSGGMVPHPIPMFAQCQTRAESTIFLGTNVQWPPYNIDNPEIIFFDTDVTNLTYVSSDVYRAEGIKYIGDHLASDFGH
ncbi:hypothetical protein AnigIFM49718_003039 [Aspergillus niger]|nr:hypothetical protein AnigIFM49718_003039 [Aspergillus niger]